MPDFISRKELLDALQEIETDAIMRSACEYDSVKCSVYDAKSQMCRELITILEKNGQK